MGMADDPELQKMISQRLKGLPGVSDGNRSISDEQLKKLYDMLYDRQFAEHEEVTIDLAGSSDSRFVDSLYRMITKPDSAANPRKARVLRQNKNANIPWSQVTAEELPRELVRLTDSLPVGGTTKPMKMSYGFFIMRVADVKIHEKVPFETAREQLFMMAQNGNTSAGIPASDKEARAYFEKHKQQFVSPDTFDLKAWLKPSLDNASKVRGKVQLFDTIGLKPLSCRSTSLPLSVRLSLEQLIDSTIKNQVIGPVMSPLGEWKFKIVSKKRGGCQLEFKDVVERIKSELGMSPKSFMDIPLTQRQAVIRDDLLAMAAWRNTMESVPQPSDEEINGAIRNRIFDLNALGPNAGDSMVVKQFVSSRLKEKIWRGTQDEWKAGMQINNRLLYW
jgi:hypothetical protein